MPNSLSRIKSSSGSVDAEVTGNLSGSAAYYTMKYMSGSIDSYINLINDDYWVDKKFYETDGEHDSELFRYIVVPVASNTKYTVSTVGYSIIYLDAEKNVLGNKPYATTEYNVTFTTPDRCAFVVVNQHRADHEFAIMYEGAIASSAKYKKAFGSRTSKSTMSAMRVLDYLNGSVNLYNKQREVPGYYLDVPPADEQGNRFGEPVKRENADFKYVIVPVKPQSDYIVSTVAYIIMQLDTYGNVIIADNTYSTMTNVKVHTNADTAALVINTRVGMNDIMLVEGSTLPDTYTPYGIISEKSSSETELYVTNTGTADGVSSFTSVVQALKAASNLRGHKTVYIYPGMYDVLEELGGMSYVSSFDGKKAKWEDVQPVVDDCDIIGLGRVVLNFLLDAPTGDAYWLFSCLNVRGNIHIENIEIHSQNCRYCIHDESGNNFPNTTREYINVRAYQNEAGGTTGGQAIGCGFSENTSVYMRDCIMRADTWAWSCHANNGCSFVYDNCVFIRNNKPALRVSQNNNPTSKEYVRLSNCIVQNGMELKHEWAENQTCQTKVDAFNTKLTVINGYSSVSDPTTVYDLSTGQVTTLLPAD